MPFSSENVDELHFSRPAAADIPIGRETLSLPDGTGTPVLRHTAASAGQVRRPVLYMHGIQSHPGWFIGSAQALARAGHEVFQITRRGSGAATARRGDATSASQLLRDVDAAVDHVLDRTGADEAALVGVSWGGKLLTAYAVQAPPRATSLTLVAPGIVPRVDVSWSAKLAIAACRVFRPGRYFDIPLNGEALFTDNPAMREYLRDDPHRLHRATARFLVVSAMLDRAIARAPAGALKVPTTLLLARRDRIIDNAATARALQRLAAGRLSVWELDAAHTIEFEPDPDEFFVALRQAVAGEKEGAIA